MGFTVHLFNLQLVRTKDSKLKLVLVSAAWWHHANIEPLYDRPIRKHVSPEARGKVGRYSMIEGSEDSQASLLTAKELAELSVRALT